MRVERRLILTLLLLASPVVGCAPAPEPSPRTTAPLIAEAPGEDEPAAPATHEHHGVPLTPTVSRTIRVLSPDGDPVGGARIHGISFTEVTDSTGRATLAVPASSIDWAERILGHDDNPFYRAAAALPGTLTSIWIDTEEFGQQCFPVPLEPNEQIQLAPLGTIEFRSREGRAHVPRVSCEWRPQLPCRGAYLNPPGFGVERFDDVALPFQFQVAPGAYTIQSDVRTKFVTVEPGETQVVHLDREK